MISFAGHWRVWPWANQPRSGLLWSSAQLPYQHPCRFGVNARKVLGQGQGSVALTFAFIALEDFQHRICKIYVTLCFLELLRNHVASTDCAKPSTPLTPPRARHTGGIAHGDQSAQHHASLRMCTSVPFCKSTRVCCYSAQWHSCTDVLQRTEGFQQVSTLNTHASKHTFKALHTVFRACLPRRDYVRNQVDRIESQLELLRESRRGCAEVHRIWSKPSVEAFPEAFLAA